MAILGQAWVTLGTKDADFKKGLRNARQEASSFVKDMAFTLGGISMGAGLVAGFKAGIQAVDDFKIATIGIAATLTDIAAKGSDDLKSVYRNNLAYAKETYQKVELEAAKWFASGEEMIKAWQILTSKGVVLADQGDIEALGVITDKIKLMTQGRTSSLQTAQEIRAVMNGQAKAAAEIASMLQDRLGPEWEKIVEQHRKDGDVLKWLATMFEGVRQASGDIEKTLESQKSTLGTLLKQVGRAGMAGAYEDIVGLVSQINKYLREHKDSLAAGIASAWNDIKSIIADPVWMEFFKNFLVGGKDALRGIASSLKLVGEGLKNIISIYNSLPAEIAGAAGAGIIGRMLFGSWTAGAIIANLSIIASSMDRIRKQREQGALGGAGEAVVDWLYGAPVDRSSIRKPIPTPITTPKVEGIAGGAGVGGGRALNLADIDQIIEAMKAKVSDMKNNIKDTMSELNILIAEKTGDYLGAELMKIDQSTAKAKEKVWKDIEDMQKRFRELDQKLAGNKGGATQEAIKAAKAAQEELNAVWTAGLEILSLIDETALMKGSKIAVETNRENRETIAQLQVQYAEMTGSVYDQIEAQIKLTEATVARNMAEAKTPEIAEWYRKLADEEERLLRLRQSGSFRQGFAEAAAEYQRSMPTTFDYGKQAFDQLTNSISAAGDALADFITTGKADFTSFANSIISDISRMIMKMMMMQLFGSMMGYMFPSGGGAGYGSSGNFLGGLTIGGSPGLGGVAKQMNVTVELKNESGKNLGVEKQQVSRDEFNNLVVSAVISDFDRGGKTWHVMGGRR